MEQWDRSPGVNTTVNGAALQPEKNYLIIPFKQTPTVTFSAHFLITGHHTSIHPYKYKEEDRSSFQEEDRSKT